MEATTGAAAHSLDEERLSSLDLGIYGARDLAGAKSASLETDVIAQRYALVVVHAIMGLRWNAVRM